MGEFYIWKCVIESKSLLLYWVLLVFIIFFHGRKVWNFYYVGESGFGKKNPENCGKKDSERAYVLHMIGECQESDGGIWIISAMKVMSPHRTGIKDTEL